MKKLALTLLLAFTSGCVTVGAGSQSLTSFEAPQSVSVTFSALAPLGTVNADKIELILLDTVTGLNLNSRSYAMQRDAERSYSVEVDVPVGSLVAYRYTRNGEAELSAAGEVVIARRYFVDGPGHVAHDVIAAWRPDDTLSQKTGRISGTVSTLAENQALPGIEVTAAGLHTVTDERGRFILNGLPQGLHTLVAFAPDGTYLPFQQGALVAAESDTAAAIGLAAAETATITFLVTVPQENVPSVPLRMVGNLPQLGGQIESYPRLQAQEDGRYSLTLELPTGVDIRYKYTLGDGFWNAEHDGEGRFILRQLIVPSGETSLTVEDSIPAWSAASPAIWFDLTAPPTSAAYLQFKLLEWGQPLPMWTLGEGHWAYKLFSPTNFSTPIEYRYCADPLCATRIEANAVPRLVSGGQGEAQVLEDQVDAWLSPDSP